ncbi:MAG: glycosyltransferase family 2 protein [Archaeoglobaceae archaeon]
MKLAVIVPVSPFESEDVLEKSIVHVKSLASKFNARVVYVIDKNSKNDSRVELARSLGVEVIERNDRRGKRAGAINDALNYLKDESPDFVLILDVDVRTDEETIQNCIKALMSDEKAYIASARRFVYNASNLVSETIEAEYRLLNFLLKKSSFKQFNGLIGVIRFEHLIEGLNEEAMAEDADFATRMHAKGLRALLVEGRFLEQAPITWADFYKQRKRWYFGGLQLWKYRREIFKVKEVRASWVLALTITYFPIIMLPLLPIGTIFVLRSYRSIRKLKILFGFVIYCFVLQFSAIVAILDFIRGKEVRWDAIRRA